MAVHVGTKKKILNENKILTLFASVGKVSTSPFRSGAQVVVIFFLKRRENVFLVVLISTVVVGVSHANPLSFNFSVVSFQT